MSTNRSTRFAGLGKVILVILGLSAATALSACAKDPAARKQQHVEAGDRFTSQGKLREAEIEYRNAVQIDPRFGTARAKLAATYEQLGNRADALDEYVRAADLLPGDAALQLTTGTYLMAAGRVNDALVRADAVLKTQPGNVEAHVLRGNALGGLNDLDHALAEMEDALRLDPTRGATYAQLGLVESARGDATAAEASFKKAVELAPKSIEGYLALANFYWASGRLPDAEQSLQAALKIDPRNIGANHTMAVFAVATGRIDEAEKYLKQFYSSSRSSSAAFTLADYYIATHRAADAVALLEPLSANPGTAVAAKQRLARAYASAGDTKKAQSLIADILQQPQVNAQTELLKGQLLLQEGRRDEAFESIKAAVATEPTSVSAQFALAKVYAARGDVAGAEAGFREVLKLNPAATAAQVELSRLQLASGAPTAALRTAEDAARNQPKSLDARLALVRGLLVANELPRAQGEIQALLADRPDIAAVHVQSGVLAATRNDARGARLAFERAIELDANSVEALAGLVALDLNARDFAAAKNRISARVEAGKVTPELLLLAARTYGSANDMASAERMLRRAIEADPTLLPAYSMLGQMYLGQRKLDEARKEFDNLAERQSRPVSALTMSGMILQAQGNLAMARQRFEQAVAVDPRAAVAANNLAWMYADAGEKLDQALRLARSAAEVLPDAPEVLDTLGWVYLKSNLPALAVSPLSRCVEKVPNSATYRFHLGLAYAKTGDATRARASLSRALELGRDASWANDARQAMAGLDKSARQ